MNWKAWLGGLISAFIGAAANTVTVMIVDPESFNFFSGGAKKLGTVMLVSGIVAASMYLKTHPIAKLECFQEGGNNEPKP